MMKKKWCSLLFALLMVLSMSAQGDPKGNQNNQGAQKFSPEKFDEELQQFITKEACLTPEEAAKFFPIYKEMLQKQRSIFFRQRQISRMKAGDEANCKKMIQERDRMEVELKQIQEKYHNKFFNVLSPCKVFNVITAEDKFHRRKLRQWSGGPQGNNGQWGKGAQQPAQWRGQPRQGQRPNGGQQGNNTWRQ